MLASAGFFATWWEYVLLFLGVAAGWSGIPFIGAAACGAAGLAASQGALDLPAVVIVSTAAGEVGGLIGYAVGSRWGQELFSRPGKHLERRQKLVERGERAYSKWGRLAVFFTPAIISGTFKMRHGQFVVWNLLASLCFTLSVVASAYGIGRLVTGHHSGEDVDVFLFGLAAGALLVFWFVRHHRRWKAQCSAEHAST